MHISNPSLPFCSPTGTYLSPGTLIRISGSISPYSQCFAINLQCGGSVNPRDDVALHLSPVFSPPPRIVRNSIQSHNWGPEESFGGIPLTPGQSFEFMILVEPSQFKIAVNGSHFAEFRHRIPFERITHIAIDGDVRIDIVSIDGNSSAPPPMSQSSAPYGMGGPMPYAMGAAGVAAGSAPYPALGFEMPSSGYGQAPPSYSSSMYPQVPQAPGGSYPQPQTSYPQTNYPQGGYPQGAYSNASGAQYPGHPPNKSGGIGDKVGAALGGLTAGVVGTSIGSKLFGGGKHSKHSGPHIPGIPIGAPHKSSSSSIPIGKIAAGAGAAALGAAVLSKVHPFKKAKKMFKHKGGWHHKGWSSSSSSSSSEEE